MGAGSWVTSLLQEALQWSLARREGAALPALTLAQRYEIGILSKGLFKAKPAAFFPVPFSDSSAPVVKKEITVAEKEMRSKL